jgi:hypothetical protein
MWCLSAMSFVENEGGSILLGVSLVDFQSPNSGSIIYRHILEPAELFTLLSYERVDILMPWYRCKYHTIRC